MAESPLSYPTDNRNYNVAWKFMPEKWAADFSGYQGRFSLPIFVGGDRFETYRETGEFEAAPQFVGLGIIYSWAEPGKWQFSGDQQALDKFRVETLLYFAKQFGAPSVDEFAAIAADWTRWNCGCVPSQRVLGSALMLMPKSSRIAYDYLIDTWSLVERIPSVDLKGACNSIRSVSQSLDVSQILQGSEHGQQNANSACYIICASLLLLGLDEEFEDVFANATSKFMKAPGMEGQLRAVASSSDRSVDDLRVFFKPQ